jgi:drug/metabolite transporter (DMT)-like permease
MYYTIIAASFLAVLAWTFVDSFSKIFIKRLGPSKSIAIILASGIIPMIAVLPIIGVQSINYNGLLLTIVLSLLGGIALFAGFVFVYKSVESAGIANSFLLVEIQPPLLIIFGIAALSESLSSMQIASILLIFLGILFVTTTKGIKLNKKMLPSIVGNIMWTMYWIVVVETILYFKEYALPMLLVRAIALIFAVIFFAFYGKGESIVVKNARRYYARFTPLAILAIVITAGIADGSGNILFAFVSFNNKVAIAAAILSIGPIIVWLIGVFVYKEKVTMMQKAGFAIATIGYIALSLA